MAELLIAPADHDAALFAVKRWHYSAKLPAGKKIVRGVWEDGEFLGVAIVSRGATATLGHMWGLGQTECVELTRVALRAHVTPVSQVIAAVLRDLRETNPGLRLVVSYADPEQGHHGGIYQAGNWIYTGVSGATPEFIVLGKRMHMRSVHAKGWKQSLGWLQEHVDPNASKVDTIPKHRYVYPLDKAMRRSVLRINGGERPYPQRAVE